MGKSCHLPILFAALIGIVWPTTGARCDDSMGGSYQYQGERPSPKGYDKRLPPVLPGEELVTESGKKMRVWSSAGPVPVMQPTPPQYYPGGGYGGFPPVIIDERGRRLPNGAPGVGAPGAPGGPVGPVGRPGR